MAALHKLKLVIHPPTGNKYDLARDWKCALHVTHILEKAK